MLNGLSPVIIYQYKPVDTSFSLFGFDVPSVGVPIPIYLDEKLTGIMGEGASNKISIETSTVNGTTYQRQVSSDVSIKLRCRNNNVVGQTLLAILGEAFKYSTTGSYGISLFYDSSFILDAVLKDFYSNPVNGTDMREIGITLSKRYSLVDNVLVLQKVANAIPLGA